MKDKDWFRNTTWNEEIEKYFFIKLKRVRDKDMQAEYLNLQAGALTYTKDTELIKVAEVLINKQLQEYPDCILYKSRAYYLLGDIYSLRGDYNKSLDYFKRAIDFEAIFPNSITNSFMGYAELIVKTKRKDLYEDVEKIMSEERYQNLIFPHTRYLKYSILSIISKHKGEIEKAQYYANLANENVNMKESGLNNHKTLGLVKERDVELDRLVGKF